LKGPKFRENGDKNFTSIMDSVAEYARRWIISEEEELDTLTERNKSIRKLLKPHIHYLSGKMRTILLSFRNQKW
jgi:hypothetical protein